MSDECDLQTESELDAVDLQLLTNRIRIRPLVECRYDLQSASRKPSNFGFRLNYFSIDVEQRASHDPRVLAYGGDTPLGAGVIDKY